MDDKIREIETELRRMQKEWIDMYEKVIRLVRENIKSDYIEDREQKDD